MAPQNQFAVMEWPDDGNQVSIHHLKHITSPKKPWNEYQVGDSGHCLYPGAGLWRYNILAIGESRNSLKDSLERIIKGEANPKKIKPRQDVMGTKESNAKRKKQNATGGPVTKKKEGSAGLQESLKNLNHESALEAAQAILSLRKPQAESPSQESSQIHRQQQSASPKPKSESPQQSLEFTPTHSYSQGSNQSELDCPSWKPQFTAQLPEPMNFYSESSVGQNSVISSFLNEDYNSAQSFIGNKTDQLQEHRPQVDHANAYMNGIRTNPEKNWYTDAYGTLYEDWNNSPQPANQCHVCCNTLAMVKDEVASLQYEVEKLKKKKTKYQENIGQPSEETVERYNGKTLGDIQNLLREDNNPTMGIKTLMKALFTEQELVMCSLMGLHTNKTVDQKPGLDDRRRKLVERLIMEKFDCTLNEIRSKMRSRLRLLKRSFVTISSDEEIESK